MTGPAFEPMLMHDQKTQPEHWFTVDMKEDWKAIRLKRSVVEVDAE